MATFLMQTLPGWQVLTGSLPAGSQPLPAERQLTHNPQGHTLNSTQVFSPNDEWIVYDTRNLDTQLGQTCCVEMVNSHTGEIRKLYQTTNQTEYGPGAGAVTFCPNKFQIVFLHGLGNASAQQPYAMTRRTGVLVDITQPLKPHFLDGRDITPPFTAGALRGGTHAHQWSPDGQWISFTYNDEVMERLSYSNQYVKDLRTVGVMTPEQRVIVLNNTNAENFEGEWYATVVTRVTETPIPDSDEIDRAFDETWIGERGYRKANGFAQKRALAFQGNVRNRNNQTVTEIFVVDLPNDLTKAEPNQPLQGTTNTRPNPPLGVTQRRITFTEHGVEGPRHWLRSKPDGSLIGFLAKDKAGLIQVFGVSPNGGSIRQLTQQPFSVQTPFNFSPDGTQLTYVADNSVFVTDLTSGQFRRMTVRSSDEDRPINGVIWSHKGDKITYNRYVKSQYGRFIQIFQLRLN